MAFPAMIRPKLITFLGAFLFVTLSRVAAQTTPCPDLGLPYEALDKGSSWGEYQLVDVAQYISDGNEVVRYQGSQPITIYYTTPNVSQHPSYSGCIKQADLDKCIADDLAAWTGICPGMFDYMQVGSVPSFGGLSITWDNDPNGFSTSVDQNGNVSMAGGKGYYGYPGANSEIVHPHIELNNSPDFNHLYVFTTCPQKCTILDPQKPVSICEVLLHEIGHTFGLDDLDKFSYTQQFSQGVMWGDVQAGTHSCPGKGLQDIDVCYFCKLYCPDNCVDLGTPLPVADTSISLAVYPNPATGSFAVLYHTKWRRGQLTVEDMLGKRVLAPVEIQSISGELKYSQRALAPGCYLMRLSSNGQFVVRLLIIQ